jgi:cytochrome c oxidase subunit 2
LNSQFQFFPESASTAANEVDWLYVYLLSVAGFFTILIFVLIFGFCIYYRRGANVDRTIDPNAHYWVLEIVWSVIPLGLALIMFAWGADIYYRMTTPPDDCAVIDIIAKQWMWKLQHPSGRQEINELHLPIDTPVRLRMISEDVIHSFYVPAFRVKQDVLPGRYTSAWFEPNKAGEYHLFCAEYCGTSHAQMRGKVIVQSQSEYAEWLRGAVGPTPADTGEILFEQYRCHTCHMGDQQRGPSLAGLAGSEVPLGAGGTVTADDEYLRESILEPNAKIVAGFQPLMPTFRGQIGEEDILALIQYIKTLPAASQPNDNR